MTPTTAPGDQARATVSVALPPDEAFRVFTEEIDLGWRRGRRFRNAPGQAGIVCIEPGAGGRLFESCATGQRSAPITRCAMGRMCRPSSA